MTEGVRPTGTYKTLAEQREILTPAEQKFEKAPQTIGLFLGPIVFLVIFTIVYWLSEAIPISATAILALALAVVLVKLLSGVCCRAA
jgi:solute carrier family 13 (sodium-dependent dicarboxylate transporter), member 2/3/5